MKCRACKGTGEVHGFDAFYEVSIRLVLWAILVVTIVRAIAWVL